MKTTPKLLFSRWLLPLLGCLPLAGWSQAYVIMPNNERVMVERILVRPNGSLVVTRGGQPVPLEKNQYVQAVGIRPPALDQAERLLAEGKGEEAAPLLQKVFADMMFQSWDVRAGSLLINLLLEQGKPEEAKALLRTLEQRYEARMKSLFPETELLGWKTRVATGETAGLEEELGVLIRDDSDRRRKAMAQLTRGDLKRRRKDPRAAALDYLRVVYFFRDIPEIQAEALYKTASAFAEIGDTGRLRKYEKLLKETYPNSEFSGRQIGN